MFMGMNENILIIGAGGFATQLIDVLESNFGKRLVFFDDYTTPSIHSFLGYPVVNSLHSFSIDFSFCVALSKPQTRFSFFQQLLKAGGKAINVVSSQALVSEFATIATEGVLILPKVLVEAKANIEKGVLINAGAQVHHHVKVGAFAEVGPMACLLGACSIGEFTQVGATAVILPGVNIGKNCCIGAGAVVTKDVPDNQVVAGVPAKPLY